LDTSNFTLEQKQIWQEREKQMIMAAEYTEAINRMTQSKEYFFAAGDHATAHAYGEAIAHFRRFLASLIDSTVDLDRRLPALQGL
jgi:hypothetical protein